MKKLLCILLVCLLIPAAYAETVCPICGGNAAECLTDEWGAVYCMGTLVSYPEDCEEKRYAVREGTRMIGEWAFAGSQVEEVILPEGVVMIDTGAFEGCTSLRRVTLPESLLIIGDSAFYCCTELADVVLPPHLYAIGPSAFVDNWRMTALVIPESVRHIGSEAFCNTHLTEIWLHPYDFEWGFTMLSPGFQHDPPMPVTIHVSEAVEEELGTIANFCAEYDGAHITYIADIPCEGG